jgi:hypothetical protein
MYSPTYLGVRSWPDRMLIAPSLAELTRPADSWLVPCFVEAVCNRRTFCMCVANDEVSTLSIPYTLAPTMAPLRVTDVEAWTAFHVASGLNETGYCGDGTGDPCEACTGSMGYDTYHRVVCGEGAPGSPRYIREIVLKNAGLTDIPQVELSAFTSFTLLDFTPVEGIAPMGIIDTPNQLANATQDCFHIPRCLVGGVTCNLPLPICGAPETSESLNVSPQLASGLWIGLGTLFGGSLFLFLCCSFGPYFLRRCIECRDGVHRRSSLVMKRLSLGSAHHPDWSVIQARFAGRARYDPLETEFYMSHDRKRQTHEVKRTRDQEEEEVEVTQVQEVPPVIYLPSTYAPPAGSKPVSYSKAAAAYGTPQPIVPTSRPSTEGPFQVLHDRKRQTYEMRRDESVRNRRPGNETRVVTFAVDEPESV